MLSNSMWRRKKSSSTNNKSIFTAEKTIADYFFCQQTDAADASRINYAARGMTRGSVEAIFAQWVPWCLLCALLV